jgi:integrase
MKAPKIFEKKDRAGFFANLEQDGKVKRVRLGDTKAEAIIELGKRLAAPAVEAPQAPESGVLMLGGLIDRWLAYIGQTQSPVTLQNYTRYANNWRALHGDRPAASIVPDDVTEVLRAKYTTYSTASGAAKPFSDSVRWQFEKVAIGIYKWAVKKQLLTVNPMLGYDRAMICGKRKSWISQEQYDTLMAECRDDNLRDLLETFWRSGARPFELFQVEARHYDPQGRRLILERANGDKVKAKKKERDAVRIITLGSANEIAARLAAELPEGAKLFRSRAGKGWSIGTAGRALTKLAKFAAVKANEGKKLNVAPVTLYVMRHSYCTRMAKAGVPACELRKLTGHANTKMLESLYDKSENDADYMDGLARKAG